MSSARISSAGVLGCVSSAGLSSGREFGPGKVGRGSRLREFGRVSSAGCSARVSSAGVLICVSSAWLSSAGSSARVSSARVLGCVSSAGLSSAGVFGRIIGRGELAVSSAGCPVGICSAVVRSP